MDQIEKSNGLFSRLKKTRASLSNGLASVFKGGGIEFDDSVLEDLEDQLIMADLGAAASKMAVESIRRRAKSKGFHNIEELRHALIEEIATILGDARRTINLEANAQRPYVILMVGVNGVGKTTTSAKLASWCQDAGHTVMLAACDTFRAAAIEQLQFWGAKLDVPVIAQSHGADAAAVAHDAFMAASARGVDVLIIDSAGRQHINAELMTQLGKIKRVLSRIDAAVPHETFLVVDGGTGQNALSQAKAFGAEVDLTGVCVTKLDGTARGGIVVALADQLELSIPFIGVGEGLHDLQAFDPLNYAAALLGDLDSPIEN
jgi:fused signal recognition particle receptor